MQYLLAVHSVEGAPAPSPEEMQTMFDQVGPGQRRAAGRRGLGVRRRPAAAGDRHRRPGRRRTTMTDGPFAETKEQLGGFWVIRAADLDEALAWAAKCAQACMSPVEVRPFDDAGRP